MLTTTLTLQIAAIMGAASASAVSAQLGGGGAIPVSLTSVAETRAQPMQNCTLLPNKDRAGFDNAHYSGKSIDDCPALCASDDCATWTYNNYNGGTCWFKQYPSRLIDAPGVTATDCIDDLAEFKVCNTNVGCDLDIVGNDVGNRAGALSDCCELCSAFNGCKAYSWSAYNGGTCWFKSQITQVVPSGGVSSASIVVLSTLVNGPFEKDVDFEGFDVFNLPGEDVSQCYAPCRDQTSCSAYTWTNFNGGTCWFKSEQGAKIAKAGVVSVRMLNIQPLSKIHGIYA